MPEGNDKYVKSRLGPGHIALLEEMREQQKEKCTEDSPCRQCGLFANHNYRLCKAFCKVQGWLTWIG